MGRARNPLRRPHSPWSHSATPRHSLSQCWRRKKPKWPLALAPTSDGFTVSTSGLIAVNPARGMPEGKRDVVLGPHRHAREVLDQPLASIVDNAVLEP